MRLSLRQGLVLSLIGAQALTAAAVGYVGNQRTQSLVTDAAQGQIRSVVALAASQTNEYLAPAARITDTVATALGSSNVAVTDDTALEQLMLGLIASQPDVSGIEFGRPDGSFVFVRRNGLTFRTKLITTAGGRHVVLVDRNPGLVEVGRTADTTDTYDPRGRPWYQLGTSGGGGRWTTPYVFFSTGRPGITNARTVNGGSGELLGVVGVDIELSHLTMFVGSLPVPGGGGAFLTDVAGDAVAVPGLSEPTTRTEGTAIRLATLQELTSPLYAAAAAAPADRIESVRAGGRNELVTTSPLAVDGLDWRVVVHAPTEAITGALDRTSRRGLFAVLAAGLGSLLLAVPLLVGLARPMRRLHRRAMIDELTGILNRAHLFEQGHRAVAEARRRQRPLAVAVFDLDGFKELNDRRGHRAGDEALREVSNRFSQLCRPGDLIGRLGGDEFALLLPDTEVGEADSVARRLRDAIGSSAVDTLAGPVSLTATVGVASLESGLGTFDDLLAAADLRMLAAKSPVGRQRLVRASDPLA